MTSMSFADLLKKKNEEEGKKPQEFYTGGVNAQGGGSGLAVQDPNDIFGKIIQKGQTFASAPPPPTSAGGGGDASSRIVVTLYKNGFTVNDGPLRDKTSPVNAKFLADLEKGQAPQGKIFYIYYIILYLYVFLILDLSLSRIRTRSP